MRATIVLKHHKDQGFAVTDHVFKLSKVDVTPDFGPQLKIDEARS
jgi:hypothetical protein